MSRVAMRNRGEWVVSDKGMSFSVGKHQYPLKGPYFDIVVVVLSMYRDGRVSRKSVLAPRLKRLAKQCLG